ncbi:hypothetical protein Q8F55_003546 [Vanrija albida]|uniref:Ser-Thr-rich glycosyl-phosphatidyl-inositol-anchored membrane family-domain-containing protein n=1 Tax=Vanrija albida TaxID=181172 RepID=A0ABR3Q530_9TREE
MRVLAAAALALATAALAAPAPTAGPVTITFPKANDYWVEEGTFVVTWTGGGEATLDFKVYNPFGSAQQFLLGSAPASAGYAAWTPPPNEQRLKYPAAQRYEVIIADHATGAAVATSDPFEIKPYHTKASLPSPPSNGTAPSASGAGAGASGSTAASSGSGSAPAGASASGKAGTSGASTVVVSATTVVAGCTLAMLAM